MSRCNHDCFHCPFHDCIAPPSDPMTKWERMVLKGSMGRKWERDMCDRLVLRMKRAGYKWPEISQALNISMLAVRDSVNRINKAAKRQQPA